MNSADPDVAVAETANVRSLLHRFVVAAAIVAIRRGSATVNRFTIPMHAGNLDENYSDMKKVFLPALLILLLFSSCSQALYKNKYDWIKVNQAPATSRVDSIQEKIKAVPENPVQLAKVAVNKINNYLTERDSVKQVADAHRSLPETAQPAMTETQEQTKTVAEENTSTQTESARHKAESSSHAVRKTKFASHYSNIDWGEVAWESALLAIILVLWIYKSNPVVQTIILVIEALLCLFAIIATLYAIYWVFKIFIEFVTMMG